VTRLLGHVEEPHGLLLALLYGAGLRVSEGLRLRVKDVVDRRWFSRDRKKQRRSSGSL